MTRRTVGIVLAAVTATGVIAVTPRTASAAPAERNAPQTVSAAPRMIKYRIQFGRCKDTCRIKVRITNISRKRLFNVRLNARLWVNGKKVGSCTDRVGTIRPKGVSWGGCTVRSAKLARLWAQYLDGDIPFSYRTKTNVRYKYYA